VLYLASSRVLDEGEARSLPARGGQHVGQFQSNWQSIIEESVASDQFGIVDSLARLTRSDGSTVQTKMLAILQDLGGLLAASSDVISEMVASEPHNCVVHGDSKVANLFHKKTHEDDDEFKWIDFQWAGFGSSTMDLMYVFVSSAQEVETLLRPTNDGPLPENTLLEQLVNGYWTEYCTLTAGGKEDNKGDEPVKQQLALRQMRMVYFKYTFLDYCRWVLGNRWTKNLDPSAANRNADKINPNLHNRSNKHVCWLTQTIVQYLVELELIGL